MPRKFLYRWTVILLLVTRLVIGEFAHAGAHGGEGEGATQPTQEMSACADHMSHHTPASDAGEKNSEPAEKDCCKGGGCECPCLHTPAMQPVVSMSVVTTSQTLIPASSYGAALNPLSGLFRPPA